MAHSKGSAPGASRESHESSLCGKGMTSRENEQSAARTKLSMEASSGSAQASGTSDHSKPAAEAKMKEAGKTEPCSAENAAKEKTPSAGGEREKATAKNSQTEDKNSEDPAAGKDKSPMHCEPVHSAQPKHEPPMPCGPASIEYIVMEKAPHLGAAIVVAAALDGCRVGEDGKVAQISLADLVPGSEEVQFPSAKATDRNFASQLFQNLLMNDTGAHFVPRQSFEARQGLGTEVWVDEQGKVTPYNDPGTGIIDRTGGFTSWEAGSLLHRLMGDKFANGVLNSSKYPYTDIPAGDVPSGSDGDIAYFNTQEELLTYLKAHEDIPVLANINMSVLYTGKRDPNQPLPDHFIAVKLRCEGIVECFDAKKLVTADDRGLQQLTVERLFDALS